MSDELADDTAEVADASETVEPGGCGIPWERLHRDSIKVTAITMLGVAVAAGVPTTIGISSGTSLGVALAWVLPGAALLIGVVTAYDVLRLRHTRYRVTGSRVQYESGIVFKTRRSLARERIRSVDVTANPLHRIFGLSRVKVGTGESGSGEGSSTDRTIDLDPVSREAGDRLRRELLRRGTAAADDDEPEGQRLATWQPAWIRYAPLSFWTPALAAFLVGGIFQVADWFGRGGLPVELVGDLIDDYGPWTVLGVGILVFVAVGSIASLAIQGEGWWNHRLDREPGGTLRVQRGLLVSRSLSLEEERLRGIEIVEPLGIRSAGAARLDVIAIGLKSAEAGSDLSTLVPAVPKDVAVTAAEHVIGPMAVTGAAGLTSHPPAARIRRLRRAAAVVVALAAIVVLVHILWSPSSFWSGVIIAAAALLAVWSFWVAVDSYRSLGHAIDGDYLVSRRGSVRRSTVHLRRSGVVGWRINQSVFQRRLGLVTVDAITAAGSGHYPTVDTGLSDGVDFAAAAVPGLLDPFLIRVPAEPSAVVPAEPVGGGGESGDGPDDEHGKG